MDTLCCKLLNTSAEVFFSGSSFAVYPIYISWLKTDAVSPTMLSSV